MDADSRTVVRSTWAAVNWTQAGYEGVKGGTFHPETGTGQGDVTSPQTWVATFDIVLCALEAVNKRPSYTMVRQGGIRFSAPEVAYADDLLSFASSRQGLQDKSVMMSLSANVLGLTIATKKLRVFKYCGSDLSRQLYQEAILIYGPDYKATRIPIQTEGSIKCLGVLYDIDYSGKS